jgi:hypothetical protein
MFSLLTLITAELWKRYHHIDGFPGENAKFWAVALPRVISDPGVSHLLLLITS